MIYIKEEKSYLKYHVSSDGKLICTEKNGAESIILYDISGEFDAVVSNDGSVHFVLQGADGELVYLKKEDNTWKKYNIFKSRKGIRRISGIRLAVSADRLCAFYIMEHTGKNLLVKHIFSVSDLYREPEVLDLTDARKDFCICKGENIETYLFFKDIAGERKGYVFDQNFNIVKTDLELPCAEILTLRAALIDGELCFSYTTPRKNSAALVFCRSGNLDDGKIITFGLSKNCCPEIITADNLTAIQWEENGAVMQADSYDGGKSFAKPKSLGIPGVIASIRHGDNFSPCCNRCATYNNYPYIRGKIFAPPAKQDRSVNENMNSIQHNNIINDRYCKDILGKLKEIENDIEAMGKNLEEICSFLDKLKEFKSHTETPMEAIANVEQKKDILSGEDIGEIDENNIKLFESTDIDSVLPDNNQ